MAGTVTYVVCCFDNLNLHDPSFRLPVAPSTSFCRSFGPRLCKLPKAYSSTGNFLYNEIYVSSIQAEFWFKTMVQIILKILAQKWRSLVNCHYILGLAIRIMPIVFLENIYNIYYLWLICRMHQYEEVHDDQDVPCEEICLEELQREVSFNYTIELSCFRFFCCVS